MTTSTTSSTGSVVTTGSTTYIASTASGLDTSSLISAAVATRTAPADTIDAEVTANKNKISAYTEVQTLVNALSSSIDALSSTIDLSSDTTSLFDDMSASITSSDGSTASTVLTGSVSTGATAGSYDITISQLAKSMKVASSTMDATTALGETGSFTIAAADGTAATIDVTSDMTLSDIADAISAESSTTGVNATLLKVSDGEYTLVLTAADTGQAITATTTSGDDVLTSIGVTASDGSFADVIQQAQDAVITLDGTTITRSSNTMTDVIPGVTLDLDGTTASGETLTLDVSQDTSDITSAVENFISAYNDLQEYLSTQETVDSDGTVSSTAYLFADSTLRSLSTQLGSLISGSSGSGSGSSAISYLSQLGITIDDDNELELSDSDALSEALASNSSALQSFFQSSYTTSNKSLLLMHNDTTSSLSFTLDITADSSGITGATVNGQSGMFTVSGNELVGVAGTPYAGLTFAISTTSDVSVDVNLTQGFADSIVNLADQYGDTSSGLLQTQITDLTSTDTTLSARSAQIRSDASTYETTLITKYANMETEISAAKIVQQEIEAILNGNNSSN